MAARASDHYKVLEVGRDATAEEIHRAYRRLARRYHPDVNPSSDARARFSEVSSAYEVLHDPASRAHYDRLKAAFRPAVPARSTRRPTFVPASATRADVPRFLDEEPMTDGVRLAFLREFRLTIRWLR